MAVVNADINNFNAEVIKSEIPVLVDFNAAWCGPCKMLGPVIDELSNERTDVKFVSVNIDDEPELADEFDVSSIPCLVLFKNGVETDRSIGFIPREQIEELLGE